MVSVPLPGVILSFAAEAKLSLPNPPVIVSPLPLLV